MTPPADAGEFRLRTRPVTAVRYTPENADDIIRWLGPNYRGSDHDVLHFRQLDGRIGELSLGMWLLQDTTGKFAPCPHGMFETGYEPVPGAESEAFTAETPTAL